MDTQDKTVLGAIMAATGVSTAAGTITVLVTTTKILGITVATTTVALPVAGLVATGGALTFGGYKMWKWLRSKEQPPLNAIESQQCHGTLKELQPRE